MARSDMQRQTALDALLDKDELRALAMRYARAIDRRDAALLRSVYHPDAIDDHGTIFSGPAEAFFAKVPETVAGFALTAHYIVNTSYRIDGDTAEGELYFQAYHRTRDADPEHVIALGRYLDRYARRDGEWRIAHRRLVWDSVVTQAMTPAEVAMLAGLGEVGGDADDLSYGALPLLTQAC